VGTFDCVIRNSTVVTAGDTFRSDIGIRGGRVAALGENLEGGSRVIEGDGLLALPGGIDAHCHLDQPMGDGSVMADDFHSGTRSAAFGGTTTVIPFAAQARGQGLRAAVDDYHRREGGKSHVDFAFHTIISDPTPEVLANELPALIEEGYSSFKIYMTYDELKLDDRQIIELLALARREGGMVMIHAENSDCIAWLTDVLEASGQTAPRFHALSRPPVVEREATHRAVSLAELVDVPVLIVHVSGTEAIEQIRWAQSRGLRVYAETCPQYLFLTGDDLDLDGFEGARCICSPPPRDEANQRSVWRGLQNGTFQVFSSDHAPFRYNDPKGKMIRGTDAPFRYVPNGIPGLETRLPLLFSAGVQEGRIDINRFVQLTATNPARIYGLYPTKGTIAVGSDADIVLWDPQATRRITNTQLHHNVDYTPYEGIEVRGWPVMTLVRGEVVVSEGELRVEPGFGRFQRCARAPWKSFGHASL
jgi:dihydropyrimidinase